MTFCGPKRIVAEQRGLPFKTNASQSHSVQKTGPFLARSRCYDGLHRVTAFPRDFSWDRHPQGHRPWEANLSSSLASFSAPDRGFVYKAAYFDF